MLQKQTILHLTSSLTSREAAIESLLNRMQSGDLKTLLSLQATTQPVPDVDYIPRHDQAELAIIGQAQGLGDVIYDDADAELAATFDELLGGLTEPDQR